MSDLADARQIHIAQEASRSAIDPSLAAISPDIASRDKSNSPALVTRLKSFDPQLDAEKASLDLQVNTDAQVLTELSRQDSNLSNLALDMLKPLEPATPSQESAIASPSARERLPSISQLTQQLTTHSLPALAEAATQQEARYSHHHSHSYSSAGAQSPILNQHQPSPSSFAAFPAGTARSPTSATGDTPYFQPPGLYAPYTFYGHGRVSAAAEQGMPLPPSLPSASSSGDSGGAADSNIEGYSTAHTTPIDSAQSLDAIPRATASMLPPPTGGYKCTYEGCTAPLFQTQYLLTSHKNVHSQDRPHYCPVKECPRGEGGKGFKRKNEMIRHGLVHKSPGYVCPFCPEREHKYPRPDNLQRHVRVHHVDKDRDDPLLQEVLNQRTEGQGKTRRRRTTITTATTILAAPS